MTIYRLTSMNDLAASREENPSGNSSSATFKNALFNLWFICDTKSSSIPAVRLVIFVLFPNQIEWIELNEDENEMSWLFSIYQERVNIKWTTLLHYIITSTTTSKCVCVSPRYSHTHVAIRYTHTHAVIQYIHIHMQSLHIGVLFESSNVFTYSYSHPIYSHNYAVIRYTHTHAVTQYIHIHMQSLDIGVLLESSNVFT